MNYNVGIIGGGPGGYSAALRVAALGGSVVLIERERVGGVCLHRGCIPTKHVLSACGMIDEAVKSGKRGVELEVGCVDLQRIAEVSRAVVERLAKSMERLLDESGVERVRGEGGVEGEGVISVDGGTRITAASIILATGSMPAAIPGGVVRGGSCWTSREALRLEKVPGALLIVGGGAIGCEFATIYNSLGSRVTIVEAMEEILPSFDGDVGAELRKHLRRSGVNVFAGSSLVSVNAGGEAVVRTPKGERSLRVDTTLVAIGRVPVLPAFPEGMLEMEGRSIRAGDDMRTSSPSVFAVGDVTGRLLLAHVATAQGRVAADNAMGGDSRMDYSAVPSCIFTHPEVASVGMGEEEAAARGCPVRVGRADYRAIGLAHATGEIAGFAKVLCDPGSGTVLGAQIIGARATDLIAEIAAAVKLRLTASDLAGVIHAHPTYGEVLAEAIERIA